MTQRTSPFIEFYARDQDGIPTAIAECWIAIAGPIVSLALAVMFSVLKPVTSGIEPLWGLAKYLAYINYALVLFNLIAGYPLDGGRAFRAIIWAVTRNTRRATLIAASGGRLFGFLFIFIGVWQVFTGNLGGGLWIAFIGWFLDNAASAQTQQVMFQGLLAGHKVSQAMSSRCAAVPADLTLQQLVDEHILGGGQRCFLLNRGADTIIRSGPPHAARGRSQRYSSPRFDHSGSNHSGFAGDSNRAGPP